MQPPERIAVLKLGAIGDVANTLPFVNRLRRGYPEARISWVIGPLAHSLVEGHEAVDEFVVLDLDGPRAWLRAIPLLRSRAFDLAIDLQRILKSGVLSACTGAPRRIGFDRARAKEWSFVFANERIPPNPSPGVTVEQYLEFADHLGLPAAPVEWKLPLVPWPAAARDGPLVVVNVGASKSANRWYPDRWARVCERLVREEGARVELTGGEQDAPRAAAVVGQCREPLGNRAGRLSLKELAGLCAAADVFVGCDTGPLHVAVAVGTPTVALFGAADAARTGPYGQAAGVVFRPADCSPCRRRSCSVPGHPCMRAIRADDVFEAIRARLHGAGTAAARR